MNINDLLEKLQPRFVDTITESAREKIINAFCKSPGNEIASGKFENPDSSAQLAANAFGFFLDRPGDLPLPATWCADFAQEVFVEKELRFPWGHGRHPWLDAVIQTRSSLIAVEAKRFEPFRDKPRVSFSETYWKRENEWCKNMRGFQRMRDALKNKDTRFSHLDGAQLVKHAIGLRNQVGKILNQTGKNLRPVLVYLYAEPDMFESDKKSINAQAKEEHRNEIAQFAKAVAGDKARFVSCTYRDLLKHWQTAGGEVRAHAWAVRERYCP